jgi:hypothetical protein
VYNNIIDPPGYIHIKHMNKQDPWKRNKASTTATYPQQEALLLNKPRDATPEEFDEWFKTELAPQANMQFKLIIVATILQAFSWLCVMAILYLNFL